MTDIILESIRAVIVGSILCFLYVSGRKEQQYHKSGWNSLIIGFALLFFGMVIDITDNFESLNKFIFIGDTEYEAYLEKVIGYLLGFVFVAFGFWKWLPSISQLAQTKTELQCSLNVIEKEISERKQLEEDLRSSEERYRTTLESVEENYFETDLDSNLTFFNDHLAISMGRTREELMGMNNNDYMPPESANKIYEAFARIFETGNPVKKTEYEVILGDGSHRFHELSASLMMDQNGTPIGFRGVSRDIAERKKSEVEKKHLEAQLLQAQKMESIGTLAGGIAHDFNNILSSVIGYTELALDEVEKDTSIEDNLQEVYAAGKRAKDLVKQILAFARQTDVELKPIQIDIIVEEVLKFIRASIPTTIEIKQRIETDSLVMGNATQIHQILMNLCTNAAHAMEDGGGTLEVTLKDIAINNSTNRKMLNLKQGNYIEIKVSDTGMGIAPEIIDSIFEPYFTTKGPGGGTGLGLSVVHGIVESCGGKITVDTELKKGTTFTIYLPITGERRAGRLYESEELPSGTESILFVDDEAPLSKMGSQILERLGYQVTARTSSVEALELFRTKPNDFDLVITDMTMPNMTGDDLAIELMKIRPDIPVILCTGYSKKMSDYTAAAIGIKAFTYKPLVKADLAKAVRKVLDAGRSEA